MPLPQLNLSLSVTDNPGSPFYAGNMEREKMSSFDSTIENHKIIITISDEKVNDVELNVDINGKVSNKVKLPTYKMTITDSKTEEKSIYEVTRDLLTLENLKTKKTSNFSFFGINIFKKTIYTLPVIAFEPLHSSLEVFKVSKYRTKKEDHIIYTLQRDKEKAILVSGTLPPDFIKEIKPNYFFYVIDYNGGQKFIGDIAYREKFIKSIPLIEIHLIKRKENIKEYEISGKGKINKIIYV